MDVTLFPQFVLRLLNRNLVGGAVGVCLDQGLERLPNSRNLLLGSRESRRRIAGLDFDCR